MRVQSRTGLLSRLLRRCGKRPHIIGNISNRVLCFFDLVLRVSTHTAYKSLYTQHPQNSPAHSAGHLPKQPLPPNRQMATAWALNPLQRPQQLLTIQRDICNDPHSGCAAKTNSKETKNNNSGTTFLLAVFIQMGS